MIQTSMPVLAHSSAVAEPQSKGKTVAFIAAFLLLSIGIWLWWIHRPHLPAYVVYDLRETRAESLHDYQCAPEIRATCVQQILNGEEGFRYALTQAYTETPDCRGVRWIVDSGDGTNAADLAAASRRGYWHLTVDYHIGGDAQAFSLKATNPKWPGSGGEADALQMMRFTCQAARNDGIWNYW